MPRVPLLMPKMSMTMEFGTVEEWLVEVGGPVTDGDAVVVVTTDKVDMDVESNCDGTLVEILAQSGEQVPVGEPIAWIETEKDDLLGDLFAPAAEVSRESTAAGEADSAVPVDALSDEPVEEPGSATADPSARRPGLAPGSQDGIDSPGRHPGLAPGSPGDRGEGSEIPASAGMTESAGMPETDSPGSLDGIDSPGRHPGLAPGSPGDRGEGSEIPAFAGMPETAGMTASAGSGSGADGTSPRAVPLARKLAAQAGLDLAAVPPSRPHRTIRARDVRAAIEAGVSTSSASGTESVEPVETGLSTRSTSGVSTRSTTGAAGSSSGVSTSSITDATRSSTGAAGSTGGVSTRPTGGATSPTGGQTSTSSPTQGELLGDAKSRRIRVATARVLEATALIPQFTVWRSLDLTRLTAARTASLKGVSWNTILLRAYALMLREYPRLNGSWAGDGVRTNPHVGVALAIDTPAGLLAPVLRDPQNLGIRALNQAIKDLAATVKSGKADPSTMGGGTGTVSNLGSFGIQRFNALLTPPQATALSLGSVEVQPAFDADGAIRARTVCEAGLTVDHRVADGADAARAFATMQEILEDPFLLLG